MNVRTVVKLFCIGFFVHFIMSCGVRGPLVPPENPNSFFQLDVDEETEGDREIENKNKKENIKDVGN